MDGNDWMPEGAVEATPSSDWMPQGAVEAQGAGQNQPSPSPLDYYVKNPAISAGKAYVNDAKDIGNMVTHPLDTAVSAVKGVGSALADPVGAVVSAVKGIPDMVMNHPLQTAAAILPGAEGAAGAIADTARATPDAMRDLSGRIGNMMVKLPDKASAYGKTPMKVMAAEKIPGNTITDYAKNAQDRLEQRTSQLNQQVSKSTATVNLDDKINSHIDNADTKAGNSLQDQSSVQDKLDEMKKRIYTQYGDENGSLDNMSLQNAIKLKRQLANDFPFAPLEAKNSTSNLLATAAHQIHHSINDAIDESAPGVSKLNDRVSSLIDISQAAQKRVSAESRSNPLGLIGTLLGAGGLAAHGVTGGLEGVGAGLAIKAASSPFVLTRVANALSTMADIDKSNLFKAAPWFKDIANKAEGYADKGSDYSKFLPPPINSKGGAVDAELVKQPIVTPAPRSPLQLGSPKKDTIPQYKSPNGLPFYTADESGRIKGTGFLMGEKKLTPSDVNDKLVMAEKPIGDHSNIEQLSDEDKKSSIQMNAEMAKEELKTLQSWRKDLSGTINAKEFKKGEFQDMGTNGAWVKSKNGMALDDKASEFFNSHPEAWPQGFNGQSSDALREVIKDLSNNRGMAYHGYLRNVISAAKNIKPKLG